MTQADRQVESFHHEMVSLIKKYQFRDRNQVTNSGVSVSQCYVIEALHFQGPLTMQSLATHMNLSISTITRVVDGLVKRKLVLRTEDARDRRVRQLKLTKQGERLFQTTWQNIIQSERAILEQFPQKNRKMLIDLLRKLNQAAACWQADCSPESAAKQ